ncbi:MAG: MFS transporter [Anaerolineales bacterium]|jgi:MFS family permease
MLDRTKDTFREYPGKFWVLVSATFIDRVGGTLIFPFFSLYITQKFEVGMTEAGVLFAIFSVSGFVGNMLGGALADKIGRRSMLLFGLVFSALSSVAMGLVNELSVFYTLAAVVGVLSDVGGPAQGAMVADLLPEEKRAEGFGVLRVAGNVAWIIGPTIGGFLAAKSYLLLFVLDAVSSLITAAIVYRLIPETKPEATPETESESILDTFVGYGKVAADRMYVAFVVASMLMTLAYMQMYSTLSVYLRDVHSLVPQQIGGLMSINAFTVVVLQFWITRKVRPHPPLIMMALGTAFYLVGFTAYGFVATYPLFVAAMELITVGEMIVVPVGQAIVTRLAPEDMRGRYMAFFGLSWTIPSAVGPWAAGMIMDNFDPRWVWYACGLVCVLAMVGFYALHLKAKTRFAQTSEEAAPAVAAT